MKITHKNSSPVSSRFENSIYLRSQSHDGTYVHRVLDGKSVSPEEVSDLDKILHNWSQAGSLVRKSSGAGLKPVRVFHKIAYCLVVVPTQEIDKYGRTMSIYCLFQRPAKHDWIDEYMDRFTECSSVLNWKVDKASISKAFLTFKEEIGGAPSRKRFGCCRHIKNACSRIRVYLPDVEKRK